MRKTPSRLNMLIGNLKSGLMFLRFPGESEKAFLHYYHKRTINQTRFAILAAIFLYESVALIDPYVVPKVLNEVRALRFLVVLPVFLTALALSFFLRRDLIVQILGTFLIIVAGWVVTIMTLLDPGVGSLVYQAGLILTIIYGYTFMRLRFGYAVTAGWACTIFYVVTTILFKEVEPAILANNALFNIIANFIGMFVAYTLESNMRGEYLNLMAMKRTHRELQKLSLFDDLTQIPNRRLFDMRLESDFGVLKRTEQPLSLILIDVDFFKEYNDCLGHQAGDRCLARVAEILQHFATRAGDLAARYGGEEFAVILTNTSIAEAHVMAEYIRAAVKNSNISHPHSPIAPVLTISIGVGSIVPSRTTRVEDLIRMTDNALYRAKEKGRDRVEAGAQ
jgi:diguanylate cyclase (GGDEF)-like protein